MSAVVTGSTFSLDEERKELTLLSKKIISESPLHDEFSSSTKDSSLKRVTSLIRKLKNIPSEPLPKLLKEIEQINLSMHFSEICASILENRPKNSAEYLAIVRVLIHAIIESGDELRQMFFREILRNISSLNQNNELNPSDKNTFSSFRYFFRLACELQLVKVADNKLNGLSTVIQKLLSQEDEKAAEFIPFVIYLLKNFKGHLPSTFAGDILFEKIYETILTYFKAMCRYNLRLFSGYKSIEGKSRIVYEQKGDIFPELESELLKLHDSFKTLRTSLTGLAEILNYPMPKFDNSDPQFVIDDGKIIFTTKIEIETEIYQDEEERDFYEKLPINNSGGDEDKEISIELPEEWKNSEEIDEIYSEEIDPDAIGKQSIRERLPKGIEQFFNQVEKIISVSDVDSLSEKINAAGKDFKIEKYFEMFFEVARSKSELVKYIARMMACIKHTHPSMIQNIISSMCGQFHFLTKRKEPILRTRRRICTFLSEFTKFRLLPQSIAFNCLKKCVKDFTGTNIDMTCYLLESSGRFLYLQPESHARMKHLIAKIGNFRKNSFCIPNDKNILLGYAIYCVTRTQTVNFILEPDFMETFFTFAFGRLQSSKEFLDLFNSITDEKDIKTLQLMIIKTCGLEIDKFDNLTLALSQLKSSNSVFVYKTIDLIICESISDLKKVDGFNYQEAIKRIQLIGRFYYRNLIGSDLFFAYLYQSITLGHVIGSNDGDGDGPEDLTRSRLILILLNSLKVNSDFHFYIKEFLAMFKCYLHSKTELSKEIHELATDVFKTFYNSVSSCSFDHLSNGIEDFSQFPVSNLFIGKLDYLTLTDSKSNLTVIKSQNDENINQELLELDKEMTKIIGNELESRKRIDRYSSDVHLPISGLLQKQTGTLISGKPTILLKKKKKPILKPLN